MTKKKITDADSMVSMEGGASVSPAKSPANKTSAPRASAKPVTHKHKKNTMAAAIEPADVELAAPVQAAAPTQDAPTHEEIARLAFTYWAGRGYWGGSPEEDWLRAEGELRNRS